VHDNGISEVLSKLIASDPDVADRDQLVAIVRNAAKLKAFVEIVEVRCARRTKQLAAEGQASSTTVVQLDPTRHAHLHARIGRELATIEQNPANAERPLAELQVEAFMNALAGDPPDQPATPEVIYHIDHETFAHGRHECTVAETEDGVPVPVSTIERACCEAILTAVIVHADGTVEQLCTPQRTANRAQRRRLSAMYSTCAHPHCTVPFSLRRAPSPGPRRRVGSRAPAGPHGHVVPPRSHHVVVRQLDQPTSTTPGRPARAEPGGRRPDPPPGDPPDGPPGSRDDPAPQLTLC
jgi:hypothetical protein